MANFTIDGFANGCKAAMADAENKALAARQFLEQTLRENDPMDMVNILNAAVPKGADIGEMIVHRSPELTMLYARVPPRFQSGIHNHTVFACIGQLIGSEASTIYRKTDDGQGLSVANTLTAEVGQVISLPEDVIHHIENPNYETAHSLHVYGGDFDAVMEERSLWGYDNFEEKTFSFQGLIQESINGMKRSNNQTGLDEIVKAIPATKQLVEG